MTRTDSSGRNPYNDAIEDEHGALKPVSRRHERRPFNKRLKRRTKVKTATKSIWIAATGMVVMSSTAVVAKAQSNCPTQRQSVVTTTLYNAQAAANRDAVLRAQLIELLRRRQASQLIAAQLAQRNSQAQALQALAAQRAIVPAQSNQLNAQLQTLQLIAAQRQQVTRAASTQTAQLQALRALVSQKPQAPLFSGSDSPQQLINKLNSMSSADVNALMSKPSIWDQFTPNWVKNAPGGNVLAQFGIGNGLMKELGTTDINKILDPKGLDAIQGKLRQAQILGNIAGGQAAQNKVYNDVQKNQNLLLAEKDKAEAMRQLYELVARTGVSPN
jgi:hypothetical protein